MPQMLLLKLILYLTQDVFLHCIQDWPLRCWRRLSRCPVSHTSSPSVKCAAGGRCAPSPCCRFPPSVVTQSTRKAFSWVPAQVSDPDSCFIWQENGNAAPEISASTGIKRPSEYTRSSQREIDSCLS